MDANTCIPIIDFAGVDGERRKEISQQLASAGAKWGFFQLVNHGFSYEQTTRMKELSKQFFNLPVEEKMKIKKVSPGVLQGWSHPVHTAEFCGDNKAMQNDGVENFFFLQYPDSERMDGQYPSNPATLRVTALEYSQKVKDLLVQILELLTEELGVQNTQEVLRETLPEFQLAIRGNFYPVGESSAICVAHSDPGFLTLLLADDVAGLEVKKDGKWVPVDPIKGAFIINVGDSLEMFSNGNYRSLEHQGLSNSKEERLTLATFLSPSFRTQIGPLKSIVSENHPPRFKDTSFEEYISFLLKAGLHGKNVVEAFKL